MCTRTGLLLAAGCLLWLATGCFSAKAPERIEVNVGGPSERVDSSRVPNPKTLEEARYELRKAYDNIRWLEHKVEDLKEDKAKYKRERDKYKDRLEKYEDD
jgi:predicted  nucleic acid-binding Zn-ribbon protein